MNIKQSTWWLSSLVVSAVLLAILLRQWVVLNQYAPEPGQLVDAATTNAYLQANWDDLAGETYSADEPAWRIRTGIFIQSLQFENTNEVNLSGYLWQKYRKGIDDAIKPAVGETGFVLPEQVHSGDDIVPRELYRVDMGEEELIGWYFEATLRQPLDYSTYPFDHKTVRVRLWAKDFAKNVVLTPDFVAYRGTGLNDVFGVEQEIVLGTWERRNTFFSYHLSSYDTNFGIEAYVGQQEFPELQYNFVIKRNFGNAFIVYLLPLFLVLILLFAALLTISDNSELQLKHGFTTSGFIGAVSALFFVVMLGHVQLREQFAANRIVYIEYFYILMYFLLVSSTVNTYLFSTRGAPWLKIIHYQDNLIPKVGFWPMVLLSMILITWLVT